MNLTVGISVLSRLHYTNATLSGLPACLINRLQSVLNAAAQSIAGFCCSELQTGGHCLPSSSWHCTSVLVRLAAVHRLSADDTSRPAALVDVLDVRPSRRVTVGDRSFAAAGPRLWNSLPADVLSAPSLTTFRQKLKTHLFRPSYRDIVLQLCHHQSRCHTRVSSVGDPINESLIC